MQREETPRSAGSPVEYKATRWASLAAFSWMLTLAALALIVGILYLAQGILIPLTLALLLSFLLIPVCDWLERLRLGRIPSVLITIVVAFTALGAGTWTAALQMMDLAPKLPEYQANIRTRLHSVNQLLTTAVAQLRGFDPKAADVAPDTESVPDSTDPGAADVAPDTESVPGSTDPGVRPSLVRLVPDEKSPLEVIGGLFGSTLVMMGSVGVVAVLLVFILIRREDLRDRFIRLIGQRNITSTTQALGDAATRVSRYLLMQLVINVAFGIPIAIGLYFIGIPNAVLWGIVAMILRFIPYIGPWAAAAAPIGLSFVIATGWTAPALTIGLFVAMELLSNNFMEPWLYGKNTGISAVALLVAAMFWTWLWGPMGLLLATPLTVCLLVLGRNVRQLAFLDTLLGNQPVFEPDKRVYQRLLAGDQEEAAEIVLSEVEKRSLVDVYDTVLIPALETTETHWHRDEIDESRHRFILQGLTASIDEMGERAQAARAGVNAADPTAADSLQPDVTLSDPSEVSVLCLPAHDEPDEIAATMLAQLLETPGCTVQVISAATLVSERVEQVGDRKPDVVCISATPPAALMHARNIYRRLRGWFPEANLIVGLWNTHHDPAHARDRLGCGPAVRLVSTLAAASEQIRQLLQLTRARATPQDPSRTEPAVHSDARSDNSNGDVYGEE